MTTDVYPGYQASFTRNIGVISQAEQERLRLGHVTVAGAGGVGGIALIQLARLGVGGIHVIDRDVFDASNLNRQMLSSVSRLGRSKAESAAQTLRDINPDIHVRVTRQFVTDENAADLLRDTDVIVDATDDLVSRVIIHRAAARLGIPSVWIAVTPPFRGAVMSFTPDSPPYEVVLRQPSYLHPLTDEVRRQLHAVKAARAQRSIGHGVDPDWAGRFAAGTAPWTVLAPVANIVGLLASFEAFKFLLGRPDLPPVIGPDLVRVNLAEPAMVRVETPAGGAWDNAEL